MAAIIKNIAAKQVSAISIMEAVIATTVLMILFGILISVYTKILPVTYTMRHVRAEHMLEKEMHYIEENKLYSDNTTYVDPYTIERSIRPAAQPDFIVVELRAKDAADSVVAQYKNLIYIQK
jgi:hypothetical protein